MSDGAPQQAVTAYGLMHIRALGAEAERDAIREQLAELQGEVTVGAHLCAKLTDENRGLDIEVAGLRKALEFLRAEEWREWEEPAEWYPKLAAATGVPLSDLTGAADDPTE